MYMTCYICIISTLNALIALQLQYYQIKFYNKTSKTGKGKLH